MTAPLLCRLGFHQWFTDSALFTSAKRCDRCGAYQDKNVGAALDCERALWQRRSDERGEPS